MQEEYNILTLSDNKQYVVVSSTELNGKNYVYLVDMEDHNNNIVCELNGDEVEVVEDNDILADLTLIFNDKLKDVSLENI